jgi:hypothetical protein
MRRAALFARAAVPALAVIAVIPVHAAAAQERLVGGSTVTVGAMIDQAGFGSGLPFASVAGLGTDVVKSATEWTIPFSLGLALGERWTVDVGGSYTRGEVTFAARSLPTAPRTVRLDGVSDVRVRATGRLLGDNVLLTLGANLPTGIRDLDADQISALGVLAAPALGINLPGASFGPGATAGIVATRATGDWAWAAAGSYEVRRRFSPIAALSAGLPAAEFDPGDAVHLSLATDGLAGEGAVRLAVTADIYTQDRLLQAGAAAGTGATTVRLGPTVSVEGQWQLPARRFQELTLFASETYRAPFERDGVRVDGSTGNYVDAGLRAALPLSPRTAFIGRLEGWAHSGMSVDNTLVTAATTSGALTLGLSRRFGNAELQPFVRARAGRIDTGIASGSVTGISGGLTLSTRF